MAVVVCRQKTSYRLALLGPTEEGADERDDETVHSRLVKRPSIIYNEVGERSAEDNTEPAPVPLQVNLALRLSVFTRARHLLLLFFEQTQGYEDAAEGYDERNETEHVVCARRRGDEVGGQNVLFKQQDEDAKGYAK